MAPPRKNRSAREARRFTIHLWRPGAQPFLRCIANWQFLVTVIVLLLFTNWLGHRWMFEAASLAGSDVLLRVTRPTMAQYCRLVTIDEHEFNKYLGEWLQPEKLADVLGVIMTYEPKVIVVDIDTSAPRFRTLKIPAGKSIIVWARVSHQEQKEYPGERRRSYEWRAGEVLGNRPTQPQYIGSPLLPQDPDSTVRGFQRLVPLDAQTPSLHWVVLQAYCDAGGAPACALIQRRQPTNGSEDQAEQLQLREFRRDWEFQTVPLSDLMTGSGSAGVHAGALGDIVLLGAKFSDVHPTPFGPRLGIELTGAAVEAELSGESETLRFYAWSRWTLKVLLALAIAWLNTRLMPRWATAGILLLLVLVFVASFIGIYYSLFRMDFLPFMIGIWIEQLVESAEHAQHLAH
jgi:CHASE2 domain-containing sensor protein